MSVFQYIDQDKIVGFLAHYWWRPMHPWLLGIRDEPSLLHELTKQSKTNPRQWNIGMRTPALITHQFTLLHRQGVDSTDKFGSDFALTIDVNGSIAFRKTAIFQTKRSDAFRAQLERNQLDEALRLPEFQRRAFTIAFDQTHLSVRIKASEALHDEFGTRNTKTFDTTSWTPSSEWIVRWFKCNIGPRSTKRSPVEPLLHSRVLDPPQVFEKYAARTRVALGENVFIPDIWHHLTIKVA